MKHLYFIAFNLFILSANAQIQFTDSQFKSKLLSRDLTNELLFALDLNDQPLIIDANNDGEIQQQEALNVSYLNVSNSGILSLNGIENFINLKTLYCSQNQLQYLNYTLPLLQHLECSENEITNLNITNFPQLSYIDCSYNLITTLDFRSLEIGVANCQNNLLSEIHFGAVKDNLGFIDVMNNQLTSLEIIAPGKRLEMIAISENPIENFILEIYSLDYFICNNTSIVHLDLSKIERESAFGNEFFIIDNSNLKSINFKNGAMDFCIPDPDYDCTNSSFTLENNPLLETVCADAGDETTYLEPFATALGFTLTADCVLSTADITNVSNLKLYPNPANNIFQIESQLNLKQVNIYNMLGQLIKEYRNQNTFEINSLKAGTYLVEIVSESGKSVQKLLKL